MNEPRRPMDEATHAMQGELPSVPVPQARKTDIVRTIKVVGWSFLGLRKRSDLQVDGEVLNPLHVVLVGLSGVLVLVVGLIVLVNWVVAK